MSEQQPDPGRSESTPSRTEFARLLARGGMTGVQVIGQDTADEVLTERRREIIETLRTVDVGSVRGLARELGRDKGAVSRDLELLASHGVVDFESEGRAKRPYLQHDHLVVEPVF